MKTYTETFRGFPVLARGEKAEPGTQRYAELTQAAKEWRAFSFTSLGSRIDENVAVELEIERDTGVRIAINPRC